MQIVGAFEAKTHFSALLEKAEKGEEIVITKHGHAVAKLVPTQAVDNELIKRTIVAIKTFNQNHSLGGLSWKELRDTGRRY